MTDTGFAVGNEVDAARLPQLMAVFASGWWTKGRLAADVQAMLDGSDLVFTVLDRSSDRLVGFARVLTDFKYLAMILDLGLLDFAMAAPDKTFTAKDLAAHIGVLPTNLYYHLNMLERHGLLAIRETRIVNGIIEKHYGAGQRRLTYRLGA